MIVDLFAGPGGWDVGARIVGLPDPVGFELEPNACNTRRAAGLLTVRQDVRTIDLTRHRGNIAGLIASPPCPEFSTANNKRRGLDSESGRLTLEPLRLIGECRPEWVALEQVPAVLKIWRHVYANQLLRWGYEYHSEVLNAADYGVAQTRKRAIMIARHGRTVSMPRPTHRGRHVSMATALGWGMTMRPSTAVMSTSGGGHGACDAAAGNWIVHTNRGDLKPDGTHQTREDTQPAPTVTGSLVPWVATRPATTVQGDTRIWSPAYKPNTDDTKAGRTYMSDRAGTNAYRVAIAELGVLQSFPDDYPWQGSKTAQAKQVGNAVPPLLAAAILGAVTS